MISIQEMLAKQKGIAKPAKPAVKPAPPKHKPMKSIADIMREHQKARPAAPVHTPAPKPNNGKVFAQSIQDMIAKQANINRNGKSGPAINITAALSSDEERAIYADFELFCKEIDKIASAERAKAEAKRAAKVAPVIEPVVEPVVAPEPVVEGVPETVVEEAVAAFEEVAGNDLLGGISVGSEETGTDETMVIAKSKKRRKK